MANINDLLQQRLKGLQNPNQFAGSFSSLASGLSPTKNDFLGMMAARRGSGMQANEAFEASQSRAQGEGFRALQQFLMSQSGQQNDVLGMLLSNQQFGDQMDFRRGQSDRDFWGGLANTVLSGGLGALGFVLGGPPGAAAGAAGGKALGSLMGRGAPNLGGPSGVGPRVNPNNPWSAPVGY